jgi:DNA-binding XRE family transcriptional regulator
MMSPSQYAHNRKQVCNLSQRKAAPLLGIHWRTVQKIEKGEFGNPVPVKYERALRDLMRECAGNA